MTRAFSQQVSPALNYNAKIGIDQRAMPQEVVVDEEWITTSTILHDLRDFARQDAWQRLDARFRRPIVSFARRLGLDAPEAEDVAQETLLAFAQAYRNGHYDREKGRLSRWLFGIAYRQALRQQRRDARAPITVAPAHDATSIWSALPDEAAATQSWDLEWEQALLEACLARVRQEVEPQTYRAFELVVRENRSHEQAAAELNVPIKTVYNAKHRVLQRIRGLREQLEASEDMA